MKTPYWGLSPTEKSKPSNLFKTETILLMNGQTSRISGLVNCGTTDKLKTIGYDQQDDEISSESLWDINIYKQNKKYEVYNERRGSTT